MERTHAAVPTRPARVSRTTMVIAAVLLAGVLVLVMDNAVAIVLSVAVIATILLVLTVGVSRVPLLRRLAVGHRN